MSPRMLIGAWGSIGTLVDVYLFGYLWPHTTMMAMTRSTKKVNQNAEQHKALRTQLELEAFGGVSSSREGQLSESEAWWRERFGWLKDRGYLLRQRYSPDWNPSWLETKRNRFTCEDGRVAKVRHLQLRVVAVPFTKTTVREPLT